MSRRTITVLPGGRLNVTALLVVRTALLTLALSRSVVEVTSIQRMTARSESQARLSIITTAPAPTDPPVNLTPPVAAGIVRIGNTLTTDDGVWDLPATFTYQWTRDGVPIVGATSSSYVPVAADIGPLIACEVTATGTGGPSLPAPSNDLASVWRDILVLRPGILIWDGQDPYCYGGAGVGAPVEELYTVDGLLLATQTITSKQATRTSGGTLDFDGADDVYVGVAAYAAYLQADCTYCLGADGLTSAAGEWCLHAIPSAGVASPYLWHYMANTGTITRNQTRLSDVGAQILGLLGAAQDLAVTWRVGTPGYGALYDLAGGVTVAGSVTVNVVAKTFGYWTLGGNNTGTTTWQGDLRHACFDDSEWSSVDLDTYRACALNAGVM